MIEVDVKPMNVDDASTPDIEIDRDRNITCTHCGRILLKGKLSAGTEIEMKCHRCKSLVRYLVL
jgi:DNA-directed RNA polymerase subunit RPC12/RpoP